MKRSDTLAQQSHLINTELLSDQQLISQAVDSGITAYIHRRKEKIPDFINTHFSLKGATRIHKKAFGKDLYRAPLNILWVVPTLLTRTSSYLLHKVGAEQAATALDRIPPGFETDVEKEINWLIYSELLELPYQQGDRIATKDALLEAILDSPELSAKMAEYLSKIEQKSSAVNFRENLEHNLREYATSRIAAADIAGSIINLTGGFIAFNKLTPGALMSGSTAAAVIAEKIAVANFWLGPAIGSWYYSVFPAVASRGLVITATGSVMATLALLSTFSGIITDPVQLKLGIHQKRLEKFIAALEHELLNNNDSPYKIKDIYMTRIFDLFDLLMTAIKS